MDDSSRWTRVCFEELYASIRKFLAAHMPISALPGILPFPLFPNHLDIIRRKCHRDIPEDKDHFF
jgi:hypothetical protein